MSTNTSVGEVLQLVVEHARELTAAAWCLARANGGAGRQPTASASSGVAPPRAAPLALEAIEAAVHAGPTDIIAREDPTASLELLATPFAALDGRSVGFLGVARVRDRPFTTLDREVVVHIAQLTAASLEQASTTHASSRAASAGANRELVTPNCSTMDALRYRSPRGLIAGAAALSRDD